MSARVTGFVLGRVIDVEDPEALGRVKLAYVDRPDMPESNWVFVVRPMASAEFGVWFMPEIDDMAVIGFLNGNLENPYMLGAIYTGSNAPPVDDVQQRVIRSSQGHEIVFDDTDGDDAVIIRDANENEIRLHAGGIDITSKGTITIDGKEVVIKGSSSIDIETSGQLTGKGSPIHLNP